MPDRHIVVPPEHLFPADEWRIVEARWMPRYAARAESVLALSNGYLGVRGTLEEGRPAIAPGAYVNGFHETWPIIHAEDAYGLARLGQTIVNVPDATIIELYVDDEPLFLPTARTPEYLRVLDMRNGILTRELVWATPSGKHARVRTTRLVSLEHRHVMAVSYEVTMDRRAPVVLCSRVINRANGGSAAPGTEMASSDPRLARRLGRRVLEPKAVAGDGDRLVLGYQTLESQMTLGVAVDHVLDVGSAHDVTLRPDADSSEFVLAVDAEPGVAVRITKYTTYQTSRTVDVSQLVERCCRTLDRVVAAGFDALLTAQRDCLDRFWNRADVTIEDTAWHPVRMQQALRWNVFHLAQATWRAEGTGVPSRGLTGDASPATSCDFATACWTRRGVAPLNWSCMGRCSPGARSPVTRRRRITWPAPLSSTSTPTSPTPSAGTWTCGTTPAS
jgi:alpha,alpha-trehalose phosphorylase